jgi:hypothetical protein
MCVFAQKVERRLGEALPAKKEVILKKRKQKTGKRPGWMRTSLDRFFFAFRISSRVFSALDAAGGSIDMQYLTYRVRYTVEQSEEGASVSAMSCPAFFSSLFVCLSFLRLVMVFVKYVVGLIEWRSIRSATGLAWIPEEMEETRQ